MPKNPSTLYLSLRMPVRAMSWKVQQKLTETWFIDRWH